MRTLCLIGVLLLAWGGLAVAQDDAPEAPAAGAEEAAEATEKPEAAETTKVTGKEDKFTFALLKDWHHVAYEKPQEKPNAQMIFQSGLVGQNAKITDNYNLWWYDGQENLLMGVASMHRIEQEQQTDVEGLLTMIQGHSRLPQGMEIKPAQLGKYVGLLGGGLVGQMFYAAVAIIPQGKVWYMFTIAGPQATIPPRWEAFMNVVNSLEATDLKPQKLEQVMGIPAPAPRPAEDGAVGEP